MSRRCRSHRLLRCVDRWYLFGTVWLQLVFQRLRARRHIPGETLGCLRVPLVAMWHGDRPCDYRNGFESAPLLSSLPALRAHQPFGDISLVRVGSALRSHLHERTRHRSSGAAVASACERSRRSVAPDRFQAVEKWTPLLARARQAR